MVSANVTLDFTDGALPSRYNSMQKYLVDEQANACQTIPSISNMRIYDGVPVKLYFISQNGIYVSEEFGEKRTRGKLKVYPLN